MIDKLGEQNKSSFLVNEQSLDCAKVRAIVEKQFSDAMCDQIEPKLVQIASTLADKVEDQLTRFMSELETDTEIQKVRQIVETMLNEKEFID